MSSENLHHYIIYNFFSQKKRNIGVVMEWAIIIIYPLQMRLFRWMVRYWLLVFLLL